MQEHLEQLEIEIELNVGWLLFYAVSTQYSTVSTVMKCKKKNNILGDHLFSRHFISINV